jgi:YesN/AraC family two-component response regulator
VRVDLAEDDVLLREGLASLSDRSGFDVVGQAGDGMHLLAMVRDQKPGLVVTDIRMPPTHTTEGLDTARVIREELPGIGILVLSAHVVVDGADGADALSSADQPGAIERAMRSSVSLSTR